MTFSRFSSSSTWRTLTSKHKLGVSGCVFLLGWQAIYLAHYLSTKLHEAITIEVPVVAPVDCEYREDNSGFPPVGLGAGGVEFNVDMRCSRYTLANLDYEVYVTGPFCRDCSKEEWNTLEDVDGDGLYTLQVELGEETVPKPAEEPPLEGAGIQYRYAVVLNGASQVEDLQDDVEEGAVCARGKDDLGYLRTISVEPWAVSAWDVWSSCVGDNISVEDSNKLMASEYQQRNPWVYRNIDPFWKPLDKGWRQLEIAHPTLFLSFCSLFYVWVTFMVGKAYTGRKEAQIRKTLESLRHKNSYLEHAAKILRHDMHSGINTYIPRGVSSLERRLAKRPQIVEELALESPLRLLKEGLAHAQKVYAGVTEFTNLVRDGVEIQKTEVDLKQVLSEYLSMTEYKAQVVIDALPTIPINPPLFCTAIDNLIRNGLKYNDNPSKLVVIQMLDENTLGVIDNGRGMTQEEFEKYSKPYIRKDGQKENGSGLGLNICIAILHEHGFSVVVGKNTNGPGTTVKVSLT